MKTPKIHVLAIIIPPAALLLSDCASTGSTQPQESGGRASHALYRQQVSSRTSMGDRFEIPFNQGRFQIPDNGSEWFAPVELTFNEPEEPDAVRIAPLVVTGTPFPDVAIEDWPSDAVDAELKAAWISPRESDPAHRHATEDSVDEWMRSLR